MNESNSTRQIYLAVFALSMVLFFGGIGAGIYQSFRTVGTAPSISYQELQDESIAQLEHGGKYAEAVAQKRLAARYRSPFKFMEDGTARDYGELCLAWYEEGDRSGDTMCYHRAALNFFQMQPLLQSGNTWKNDAELKKTLAKLAKLKPIETGKWNLNNPRFIGSLAWTMATSAEVSERSVKLAVVYAEAASKMSGNNDSRLLDTLAAAYAANGQFENAVATVQNAIQMATSTVEGQEDLAAMKSRLALYKTRRPYIAVPGTSQAGY